MSCEMIEVDNLEKFLSVTGELRRKQWAFRGHADSTWKIESTLSRFLTSHEDNIRERWQLSRERQAVRKFQKAAHHFLTHLPHDDHELEWLAVMRHHGAPTRLIDFTYSPITALFFAVGDQFRNLSARFEVHAIHMDSVFARTRDVLGRDLQVNVGPADFKLADDSRLDDFVGFFDGRWNTSRQIAQQGLFMVTSQTRTDVHAFLDGCLNVGVNNQDSPWLRFVFKGGRRMHKEITEYLLQANQTDSALFPGIDGLAKSLFMKFYEPSPPTEFHWRE
jgi:hypothetical protein